jgi:hypothetical protein
MHSNCFLRVWVSHCQLSNIRTNIYETWCIQHGISAHLSGYIINLSHLSAGLYVHPNLRGVAKQRKRKNITAERNAKQQ